jgi:ankyrin repeat protein/tetratricopeptide (TPR) repeat protein
MVKISGVILLFVLICLTGIPCEAQGFLNLVSQGKGEKVKNLLQKHKSLVNQRDSRLSTPLHVAAQKSNIEMVKMLLENSADVNAQDDLGRTPLHRSISPFGANLHLVDLLLQHGANPNIQDNDGNPAISHAIDGKKLDLVKKLVAGGYSINKTLKNRTTVLHQAAERGDIRLIAFLIERGAYVKAKDIFGITPLHIAAVYGHKDAVGLLIAKGADINATSKWCGTPIHQAEAAGHKNLAGFLKENGAVDSPRNYPMVKGRYLGIEKPGKKPQLFAPQILQNIFRWAKPPAFSSDGKELYWSGAAPHGNGAKIWTMKQKRGKWTYPRATFFSSQFKDQLACLSPNGRRLLFNSRRPLQDGGKLKDADLWMVERKGKGWSDPVNLGPAVNTKGHEMRASIASSGTLYLDSNQFKKNFGGLDIYLAKPLHSSYAESENLGPAINSRYTEAYPAVAPDESYLIFSSDRAGGFGTMDLYISFRQTDGSWSRAKNMGKKMNSTFKIWPSISRDGKYLFYVSNWQIYWVEIKPLIKTLKDLPYSDILTAWSPVVEKKGIAGAIQWYRHTKQKYGDYYNFSEAIFNTMGYRLLGKEKINEALEIFKLAVNEFPQSWNAFDSYGEALMKAGKNKAAVLNYKKSLELDPGNENAKKMLKRLKSKK